MEQTTQQRCAASSPWELPWLLGRHLSSRPFPRNPQETAEQVVEAGEEWTNDWNGMSLFLWVYLPLCWEQSAVARSISRSLSDRSYWPIPSHLSTFLCFLIYSIVWDLLPQPVFCSKLTIWPLPMWTLTDGDYLAAWLVTWLLPATAG